MKSATKPLIALSLDEYVNKGNFSRGFHTKNIHPRQHFCMTEAKPNRLRKILIGLGRKFKKLNPAYIILYVIVFLVNLSSMKSCTQSRQALRAVFELFW